MIWKVITAQVLAMVFAAVLVLVLRDALQRGSSGFSRAVWLCMVVTAGLVVWAIWLMVRESAIIDVR
jgi:hypothetical protein